MRFLIILLLFCGCTQLSPRETYYNAFELTPSIYGEHITILMSPPEDAQRLDTTIDFRRLDGITLTEGGNIIIWFPFFPTTDEEWSVVHHELFHATYSVLNWVNIPLTQSSEEAYAYLLGYITREFYKKINRQEWTSR